MSHRPWYHDGLRFQCTGCGDCCTGAPGYVWVNKAEIEGIAAALGLSVVQFERKYIRQIGIRKSLVEFPNGDCALLDAQRRCTIYEVRPRQCRTWPFWESNLASPDRWQATCWACPGSGRGPVVPVEDIQSRLHVLKV